MQFLKLLRRESKPTGRNGVNNLWFCELKLYDRREGFPFNIVQYVHFSSNVPRCILYGIFGTKVIRYFRINNLCIACIKFGRALYWIGI